MVEEIVEMLLSSDEIEEELLSSFGYEYDDIRFIMPYAASIACERLEENMCIEMVDFEVALFRKKKLMDNIRKVTTICFLKDVISDSIDIGVSPSSILQLIENIEKDRLFKGVITRFCLVLLPIIIGFNVFTNGGYSLFTSVCLIIILILDAIFYNKINKQVDSCRGKLGLVLSAKEELKS